MIELNSQLSAMLKIGENEGETVWGDLGKAFESVSQSMGEKSYTAAYLGDGGFSSSEVTGHDYTITFNGSYMPNDPVIKYIFSPSVLYGTGEARKSVLKITKNGRAVLWNVTLTKITEKGGGANERNKIVLEMHGNGKPTVTEA